MQISNTGDFETADTCLLRAIGDKGRYICDHGKDFEFARVPILPEECSHEWDRDGERCVKCGDKDWMASAECEPSFDGVQALHAQVTIRRKLESPYWEYRFPPSEEWVREGTFAFPIIETRTPTFGDPNTHHFYKRQVTHAKEEPAVLIDGRFYALEWIKSGVGVLPQQCEVV